ncbi:MAG: hypothetical protein ACP5QR_14485 [Rhizomicrobium sp.]
MSRYVIKARVPAPKAEWLDHDEAIPGTTAMVIHEREPQNTGLVDRFGNAIYAEADPIGFIKP